MPRPPKPPTVSVVLPTRDREELLRDCLDTLADQDLPSQDFEVIVVDDGSRDATPDTVTTLSRSAPMPVRYVRNRGRGVNAARNTGIANAAGDVICFVDDDELVPPNHLRHVRDFLEEHPDVHGVGGPFREFGPSRARTCSEHSLAAAQVTLGPDGDPPFLIGGNMAIRAATFAEVGGFDDELSGYGDESEWFHRAHSRRFVYRDDLWVWHRRDQHSALALLRQAYRQGANLPRYHGKVGGSTRPSPARALRALGHLARTGCWAGAVEAVRVLGAVVTWVRLRIRADGT